MYQISNLGNLKSFKHNPNGKFLKRGLDKYGYYQYVLCKNNTKKNFREHKLVAEAFIPNPNNYICVNHMDEDKTNNCVTNLEWCSVSYNNSYGTRLNNVSKSNKRTKKIYQYTLDNKYINEWENSRFAALGNNLDKKSKLRTIQRGICQCCEGKRKSSHGYIWKYEKVI